MQIREIIGQLGGECLGDDSLDITGVNAVRAGRPGEITFAANRRYFADAEASGATAIVVPPNVRWSNKPLICTANVLAYVADLIELLHPPQRPPPGVHATAVLAPTATVGERVSIGAKAVIEDGCTISDDCVLGAGVCVGRNSAIGQGTHIHANVTIYPGTIIGRSVIIHSGAVIGADGFRFVPGPGGPKKMPQIGIVQIDDHVEIGANTCIDRASFGVTHIQAGAKLDNLVHIGHNCVVGARSLLAAQCGLSGSVTLGQGVMLGGQVGVADHLCLADGARVGGQSGVMENIPPAQKRAWFGTPARPMRDFAEDAAVVRRLAKIYHALRGLVENHVLVPATNDWTGTAPRPEIGEDSPTFPDAKPR
jgi:UDP-3-O-[3-hydroxymyristoyl] glucosamine N-acyltransferase